MTNKKLAERDVDDNFNINPKHKAIAALGRKMIDMSSKTTGTDDNSLMMANALSRLGEALESFGANFGPKSMADVAKKTGMSQEIIQMLIKKAKSDNTASTNRAAEPAEGNKFSGELKKAKDAGKDEFEVDGEKHRVQEGLADMADIAERDHEVQMARAELYKIAKYSMKLHELLKGVSEAEGIEGWMQSKITKAADYMGSVYHTLDYDMATESKKTFKNTMTEADADAYKKSLSQRMSKISK
jgi:DNA-binding phage protein